MVEATWQLVGQIARSRPFLLCVILVLGLFLWTHYTETKGQITVVSSQRLVITHGHRGSLSNKSGLISDTLSATKVASNEGINKDSHRGKSHIDALFKDQQRTVTDKAVSVPTANCKKKVDVSFLKVHKAGSTTVMNIFLRFAIEHNLNIVLPHKADGFGFNYLGYGKTVSRDSIVPLPDNESYNILCNHVVYNKEAFRSIMPADTTYVGILREPISHFISAASYYGFYKSLKEMFKNDTLNAVSEFLHEPKSFPINTYFVNNRMSFDFGISKVKFNDEQFIDNYIKELDSDYELVMIMERFQESLVLLRRTLCWNTKDILYVPLNQMSNKPDFQLDDEDLERLKKWNSADLRLYAHFRAKFDSKVLEQGQDLQEEVKSFKEIQESVKQFCSRMIQVANNDEAVMTVPETRWGASFYVSSNDCRLMTESELPMMKRLITNAWKRFSDSAISK